MIIYNNEYNPDKKSFLVTVTSEDTKEKEWFIVISSVISQAALLLESKNHTPYQVQVEEFNNNYPREERIQCYGLEEYFVQLSRLGFFRPVYK